jgi:hypothetical protein
MRPLSKATKKLVREFAAAYASYVQAIYKPEGPERDNAISVWGYILRENQKALGVEMMEDDLIAAMVRYANEREDERRRASDMPPVVVKAMNAMEGDLA